MPACHVLAWDAPGYGGKPQVEPYTFENVARALESTIDGMTADPVVVVGHSMGGMIAQEAYALFPHKFRALALTFTSSAFGGTTSDFAQQFIDARIKPLDLGRTMAEISSGLMKTMHGTLSDPKLMLTEFHGHTEQVNGIGDLMFYSKTGGTPESGVFTAPWDGIHGWYLKNDSPKDVVVTLELAGFYALAK